ncbi:MAG: glutamate 5-kinase, partial [Acetivibrio ethanolgignens]
MRSLNEKKRIVVKLGTSTLTHEATGELDLIKMEKLVRILTDLNNQGKEIVVVSSGAIGVGRKAIGLKERPKELSVRQACAAIGQARLMMVYQKLFSEYNCVAAQVLLKKNTMTNDASRYNAQNTFEELL